MLLSAVHAHMRFRNLQRQKLGKGNILKPGVAGCRLNAVSKASLDHNESNHAWLMCHHPESSNPEGYTFVAGGATREACTCCWRMQTSFDQGNCGVTAHLCRPRMAGGRTAECKVLPLDSTCQLHVSSSSVAPRGPRSRHCPQCGGSAGPA